MFALKKTGSVPVLLERDDNFPPWDELCAEIKRLDAILRDATSPRSTGTAPGAVRRESAGQLVADCSGDGPPRRHSPDGAR
jgi:hypothetical protein